MNGIELKNSVFWDWRKPSRSKSLLYSGSFRMSLSALNTDHTRTHGQNLQAAADQQMTQWPASP